MNDQIKGVKLVTSLLLDDLNEQVLALPLGSILSAFYIKPWLMLFPYKL